MVKIKNSLSKTQDKFNETGVKHLERIWPSRAQASTSETAQQEEHTGVQRTGASLSPSEVFSHLCRCLTHTEINLALCQGKPFPAGLAAAAHNFPWKVTFSHQEFTIATHGPFYIPRE